MKTLNFVYDECKKQTKETEELNNNNYVLCFYDPAGRVTAKEENVKIRKRNKTLQRGNNKNKTRERQKNKIETVLTLQ